MCQKLEPSAISQKARIHLERAKNELWLIGKDSVSPKPRILNVAYNMGQHNVYMEILGNLDFKEFARLHDEMKPDVDTVLHGIERIYSM